MIAKTPCPLGEVYRLMEPGPVVLVSTASPERPNIMTMSWHMMMEFEPPLIGCVLSDRNYSFGLLNTSGECVLNIPPATLAEKVVACGNCSGEHVDKFQKFGLTPEPATLVAAPLIAECFASLECRVVDRQMLAKYSMFVLEVVAACAVPKARSVPTLHHQGMGHFMLAGRHIHLPSAMK